MIRLLSQTAWPMDPPPVYGTFHLVFSIAGTLLALAAALCLARLIRSRKGAGRVLFVSGLILALMEAYKQLFLTFIAGQGSYEWWSFPFQLCSMPMYLCLILPLFKEGRLRTVLMTFLADYGILGALATFIDPSGLMRPYLALTVHGFLWHILLFFIGFYILAARLADLSVPGFARTLPLLGLCCLTAELLNTALHGFGTLNLFYISPYEKSTQLFFSDIQDRLGMPAGLAVYLLFILLGAYFIHGLAFLFSPAADRK